MLKREGTFHKWSSRPVRSGCHNLRDEDTIDIMAAVFKRLRYVDLIADNDWITG